MTTAILTQTNSSLSPWNGSSVVLGWDAQDSARHIRRHQTGAPPTPVKLYLSAGVSPSASALWQMAGSLIRDSQAWFTLFASMPDAEHETVTITANEGANPDVMESLAAAAQAGDERAFVSACSAVDWQTRSAEDHAWAIQLALSAGAHLAARNLASQAAKRFPSHLEMQRYNRVLAPPTVTKNTLPADPSLAANRDWLATCSHLYRGKWVGLRNGQLLGSASSLAILAEQIGDTKGVLLTKVF